jgi:hypothetical protein
MLITKQSFRDGLVWILLSVATLAGVWSAYPYSVHQIGGHSGGSPYGRATGIIGTAMILFAMALIVRKTWRTLRVGRTYAWLHGHVWLGLVSFPVIWFHAGWRWGGPLTTWLMIIFSIVWVTGIIGLVIQNIVPRIMLDRLPRETIYSQLGEVGFRNLEAAQRIVDDWAEQNEAAGPSLLPGRVSPTEALRAFFTTRVQPFLLYGTNSGPRSYLTLNPAPAIPDNLRAIVPTPVSPGGKEFAAVRTRFVGLFDPLARLEAVVTEHEQHLLQRKLHWLMHGWLLLHVPMSIVMFVMIPVHAIYAIRY